MRIVQVIPMVSAKNGKNNLHKFEMYFMKIDYFGFIDPPISVMV